MTDAVKQQPEKHKGAPECGLYIRLPAHPPVDLIIPQLKQIFFVTTRSAYEKNMHVLEMEGDAAGDHDYIEATKSILGYGRTSGFATILRGGAEQARAVEADGVMLDRVEDIGSARAVLGAEAIIGVRCGLSRDMAEAAIAAGADYVSFTGVGGRVPDPALLSWWATRTALPALAEGLVTNDDVKALVHAGAVFVDATDYILKHPQGVMQAVSNMIYAIELATEKTAPN